MNSIIPLQFASTNEGVMTTGNESGREKNSESFHHSPLKHSYISSHKTLKKQPNRSTKTRKAVMENNGGRDVIPNTSQYLPPEFLPGACDVIVGGWGERECNSHEGNNKFRSVAVSKLDEYLEAKTTQDKTNVLLSIVSHVRKNSPAGGFVRFDPSLRRWFRVNSVLVRGCVFRAFREAAHMQYSQNVCLLTNMKNDSNGSTTTQSLPQLPPLDTSVVARRNQHIHENMITREPMKHEATHDKEKLSPLTTTVVQSPSLDSKRVNKHQHDERDSKECQASVHPQKPVAIAQSSSGGDGNPYADHGAACAKPKRPLSAYNYFFRAERERILQEIPDDATKRNRGSRYHGKIGFAPLAQTIAARWKGLDSTARESFEVLAARDKSRYEMEMACWKKATDTAATTAKKKDIGCNIKQSNIARNITEPMNHEADKLSPSSGVATIESPSSLDELSQGNRAVTLGCSNDSQQPNNHHHSKNKNHEDEASAKPKRPLSAYNLFFREERERILREIPDDERKKRSSRYHGKIGFAPLARTIAAKWKSLDSTERERFQNGAAIDKSRYETELACWKSKNKSNTKPTTMAGEADQHELEELEEIEEFPSLDASNVLPAADGSSGEINQVSAYCHDEDNTPFGEAVAKNMAHYQSSVDSKQPPIESNDHSSSQCHEASAKPKRPLTAYNLFFRNERERILQEIPRDETKKRSNSRCHGKIGFAPLAQTIAARWKSIDSTARESLEILAAKDKSRYEMEMASWKAATGATSKNQSSFKKSNKKINPSSFSSQQLHSDVNEGPRSVPESPEKKNSARESTKNSRPYSFPTGLHQMLMDLEGQPDGTSIASFLPDGKTFVVHKPMELMNSIIPKYFKMSSFESFKRQLRIYGFEFIKSGPNKGGYFHSHFGRDQPRENAEIERFGKK